MKKEFEHAKSLLMETRAPDPAMVQLERNLTASKEMLCESIKKSCDWDWQVCPDSNTSSWRVAFSMFVRTMVPMTLLEWSGDPSREMLDNSLNVRLFSREWVPDMRMNLVLELNSSEISLHSLSVMQGKPGQGGVVITSSGLI
jgi:hypothetical protein